MVWQDFPSISDRAAINEDDKIQFKNEYTRWMAQRGNHPSIIQWVVFNEAWGQFDTNSVTTDVMRQDPSRLVTGASGWNDHPVVHIVDLHVYPGPSNHGSIYATFDASRAAVIGEMWGQSFIPKGHCWFGDEAAEADPRGGFKTAYDYLKAYTQAVDEIILLQNTHGYNAAVFTQITDVEAELNGYYSYDRKIKKIETSQIYQLNKKLFSANIE